MITRIDPPIPLYTTKGPGLAHFIKDEGYENSLIWIVFLDETSEIWCFSNEDVRAQENYTHGRNK